jgi:hypothetical protein
MAKIESFNLDGKNQAGINLSKAVGIGGPNLKDDVMVVQALFTYIAAGIRPGAVGSKNGKDLPGITGVMDVNTYKAIIAFQSRNAHFLLSKEVTGKIEPANNNGQKIVSAGKQLYSAMTLLNVMAHDASVLNGSGGNYVSALSSLANKDRAAAGLLAVIAR